MAELFMRKLTVNPPTTVPVIHEFKSQDRSTLFPATVESEFFAATSMLGKFVAPGHHVHPPEWFR